MTSRLKSSLLAVSIVAALHTPAFADESKRQVEVERKSEHVMPFDMNATMHSFVPTPDGGVQTVFVHNGDAKQIALVRAHLRKEATAFAQRNDHGTHAGMKM